MEKYTGKSIFKGIAIGKILFYQKGEQPVKRMKIEDTAEQIKRYEDARAKAAEQLQGLYEKALKEVGEANAAVFEVHQMMLEDDDYIDSVVNIIETQQVNAEFAVATTGDNFAKMFAEMEDDYFKARAADVKDISERMVNILSGNESGGAIGDEPVIVVAEDLAPSETVQMDKEKLLAFVTRLGSANSHTAILARTMNIPALIEVDIKEEWNGKMAVVDGYTGTFYIDPDEEAQFQAYKTVAENMAGKKVIVRTLDIGADKQVDYFNLDHEENPAMGYRAIRICLDRRDIFSTQLRALLRASAYGNIGIMYPMIISVDEVKEIKKIVESIKAELTEKGIEYGEVEQGIMIETPAAVMISDLLAEEVDFFSIGTNDLTQYTLAIDRQNSKLDNIYDAHHPAVLRMIQQTIENGHKAGCWVGICGELGADMTLTETFLKMGIDELSVSPTFVLPIRKLIREMSTK